MSLAQDVDAIIEEEKLGNDSAVEEHEDKKDDIQSEGDKQNSDSGDGADSGTGDAADADKTDETEEVKGAAADDKKDEEESVEEGPSASDQVAEAKSFMENLNANGYEVLDKEGKVRPFEEVVPTGAYLAAQLNPVKVTGKDGKQHEFLLINDVEKVFPDGFEAKNNIEQLKFERGIMANENKFETAVKTYEQAKETYAQEVGEYTSIQSSNTALANEYVAMAEAGLVPKVGDPTSPSKEATQELDSILEYMNTKNAELAKQGLGQINSLWVAKQFMDKDAKTDETKEKAKTIDQQRKSVASLSSTPTAGNDKDTKKRGAPDLPLNQYVEQLIASENLK
jgi:hypothetical protein